MPPMPMSPAPRSPEKLMTLIFSSLIFPLRLSARRPAAMPTADEPPAPSWVCIHGTIQGVVMYEVLATYMQPVAPRSEEHTSELQSRPQLVCRLLLAKK